MFDLTIADPLERIVAFWAMLRADNSTYYDSNLYNAVTPTSASLPTPTSAISTYSLVVTPQLCNRMNNLHGGAAATLFDIITTTALAPLARPGAFAYPGVSRTLTCTYLRPVPEGMRVVVECEVVGVGRRLCAIRGIMRVDAGGDGGKDPAKRTGAVLVTCEHGKASVDPPMAKA